MDSQTVENRCSNAVEDFDGHERRGDGLHVIESLCGGLTLLRDAFFARAHRDVELRLGIDSLVVPISEEKTERTAKLEIEIFQVVVSAAAAEERKYVADGEWFRGWLSRLRLGELDPAGRAARRVAYYAGKSANDRRLAFSNVLALALPESERAPLVLLKLFPVAVEIATALAFGDSTDALRRRREQEEIMPAIADCHACHGKPLENGEQCAMCGNPLWTYDWLTSADE